MTHSHIGGGDLPRSLPHWENVSSQPSPAVHTLLIDNHDSYTFNVFQYLATINGVAPTVIRNDEFTSWREAKASVGPVHNIVISPGPGTAENEHDFGVCSEALREAAVPILGICLGHQGLGHVYGGKIQRTPRAVHGRRSAIDFIEGYKLFEGVKRGTLVVRYHSLQVDKDNLPKCLEPTCWTTDEDNVLMGIRHRDLPLHGVQFHPESIGTTAGYKILENFRDMTLAWWADRGSEWPYIAPKNTGKHQVAAFAKSTGNCRTTPADERQWCINIAPVDLWQNKAAGGEQQVERSIDYFRLFSEVFGSDPFCFWLDSSSGDLACAGHGAQKLYSGRPLFSYMGSSAGPLGEVVTYSLEKGTTLSHMQGTDMCSHSVEGDIFCFLRSRLATFGVTREGGGHRLTVRRWTACVTYGVDGDRTELSNDVPAPRLELSDDGKAPEPWEATAVPFAFPCGYAGFFGYELRHVTERYVGPDMQQCSLQKDIGNHSTNVPDAAWIFSDRMIVLNHESNELFLSWLTPSLGQDRQSRKSGETAFSGLCPCDPWAFSCDTDKVAAICQSQQQWAEMTLRAIALASSPVSAEPPLVMRASEKAQLSRGRTPDLESPAQRQAADLSMRPTAVGEERNLPPAKGSPVDDTLCALGSDSRAVDASLNGAASGESSEKHSMALSFHDDVQTYKANIRTILDYIAAGEVYEVCLTTELAGALNPSVVSPLQFYGQLRCRNPSPFAAFLRFEEKSTLPVEDDGGTRTLPALTGGQPTGRGHSASPPFSFSICCSSPERFLMKDVDGWLESKPIKGTRPRGKTPEEDRDLVNDLATNEKDMVENLMIVDLVRNDLGRVCIPGTVHVPELMVTETYATVHQLVSTIRGKLREPEVDFLDAVISAFPGGSMTGAPKERAMEIIERLEERPRGIYSGATGFLSVTGEASLNIVIRTVVFTTPNQISVGAGGAIVALSDPDEEWEEMLLKANSVLRTLTACVRDATTRIS
uniref:aminodeoxychorismate synthase n=1 Tax=Neospora caninum (strain Liverpool) TaxID=572307 RepID=A0A0F7U953_NEOCL|nr:TPA: para-aminobenzoate synthase, putative [Neospora caninum Liverpool]